MIATDRFVFLHLHKSGGTFVNECLLRCVPGARQLGYHLPRAMIPAALGHLPILGLVRNPWSYYVSWYAFQAARPQPNPLFAVLSSNRELGFAATIRNMLELGCDRELLAATVRALPAGYTNRGLNLPGPALARIADSGEGFYSFLFRYMFGEPVPPLIARMEARPQRAARAARARRRSAECTSCCAHIAEAPPSNVSSHGDYTDYYDSELAELVALRDRAVIAAIRISLRRVSVGRPCESRHVASSCGSTRRIAASLLRHLSRSGRVSVWRDGGSSAATRASSAASKSIPANWQMPATVERGSDSSSAYCTLIQPLRRQRTQIRQDRAIGPSPIERRRSPRAASRAALPSLAATASTRGQSQSFSAG